MPSSSVRRSTLKAACGSSGSPQTPGPHRRIAPKPRRLTARSPPTWNVPAAEAFGRGLVSDILRSFHSVVCFSVGLLLAGLARDRVPLAGEQSTQRLQPIRDRSDLDGPAVGQVLHLAAQVLQELARSLGIYFVGRKQGREPPEILGYRQKLRVAGLLEPQLPILDLRERPLHREVRHATAQRRDGDVEILGGHPGCRLLRGLWRRVLPHYDAVLRTRDLLGGGARRDPDPGRDLGDAQQLFRPLGNPHICDLRLPEELEKLGTPPHRLGVQSVRLTRIGSLQSVVERADQVVVLIAGTRGALAGIHPFSSCRSAYLVSLAYPPQKARKRGLQR